MSATRRHHRQRGAAAMIALTLVVLVGLVGTTLAGLLNLQANRTRGLQQDAQLRQMLHAGAMYAIDKVAQPGVTIMVVPRAGMELPAALTDHHGDASIRLVGAANGVAVIATLDGRRATQQLHLTMGDTGYRLTEAKLTR